MLDLLVTGGLLLTLIPVIGAIGWLGLRTRTMRFAGRRWLQTGTASLGVYADYGAVGTEVELVLEQTGQPLRDRTLVGVLASREPGPFGTVAYVFEYAARTTRSRLKGSADGLPRSQLIVVPREPDPAVRDTIEQAMFMRLSIDVIVFTSIRAWGPVPAAITQPGSIRTSHQAGRLTPH